MRQRERARWRRVDGKLVERVLVAPAVVGAAAAFALDARAREAADQARGPFLLVAGLLMLGLVADRDGVFAWAGARLLGVTDRPRRLLAVALALVAVVTALLNLDTAVVFLTPVLIGAARGADADVEPFLYGSVLMANASSLLLPGANLTSLLVLADEPVSGATFVALRDPGVPVLAVGIAAVLARRGIERAAVVEAVGPLALLGLFGVAVLLGLLARAWSGPADLLASASPAETTAIGALAAILVNNLPAAVLLSAAPPPHPRALLLGLNVGPNLAVTGALSSYLWLKAARTAGERPSALRFSVVGAPLALAAMAGALLTGAH
jgi:arsenical pump membrane protein